MDRQTEEIQQSKETAMHSPRVAPCVPLCGLLQEGGGICIPLRVLFGLLGECGRSPKGIGKLWITTAADNLPPSAP